MQPPSSRQNQRQNQRQNHCQNPFAISERFIPATAPRPDTPTPVNTWWFICQGSNLVIPTEAATLPQAITPDDLEISTKRQQFLGYLDGQPCIATELIDKDALPKAFELQNLRSLYGELPEDLFAIAARAVQIIEWDRTHQFCGHCGTPTTQPPSERAKRCPSCQLRQYPKLSPAVIMLVYRGSDLLLARAPRFRAGMYSVLAGFVEPGESLEETVAREVKEEVGIGIKNIRYFGSQPWPFPKSLMIGFTAEYASGTISPDPAEIEAADWFSPDSLPPVPGELSIARKLINWFVTQQAHKS